MKTKFMFALLLAGGNLFAQIPKPLTVSTFTNTAYPNIEPAYSYDFVAPVNAEVLTANPATYQPAMDNRYGMSVFGPRHRPTPASNVDFFDYHQGMDFSADVKYNGVVYNASNPANIICRCKGTVYSKADSTNAYLETTENGRSITIKCDSSFHGGSGWGNMYMAYRHLASIASGLPVGTAVSKGTVLGVMGQSGQTTLTHLHYSLQRKQGGSLINVHPIRAFSQTAYPHLYTPLVTAEITQLETWPDSALFRIAVPYNMSSIRVIKVSLPNGAYSKTFDFETENERPANIRDNNNNVAGLELYAYPFNEGEDCHRRVWNAYRDAEIPLSYPASPDRGPGNFYPFLHEGLNETPAYVLDLKVKSLPAGYDIQDLKIEVIDIWGNGVQANGVSQPTTEHFAWNFINHTNNDAEQWGDTNGTMSLDDTDLDLIKSNTGSEGLQKVGLRFTNLGIPKNAVVTNAYVQFKSNNLSSTQSATTTLSINADTSANSPAFDVTSISNRPITTSAVTWNAPTWLSSLAGLMGNDQKMTGLAPLIQTVASLNDWTTASPLTFIISSTVTTSKRDAKAYNPSNLFNSPYLYVEYTDPVNPAFVSNLQESIGEPLKIGEKRTVSPVANESVSMAPASNSTLELFQNRPNPFSQNTLISYRLSEKAPVTLKVFDGMGREIATLVNGVVQDEGLYEAVFPSAGLTPGVYFYQLRAGAEQVTKSMVVNAN